VRPIADTWQAFLAGELERRRGEGLLRTLRPLVRADGYVVTEDGRRLLDLSSNDYLGLTGHPAVLEAAAQAARRGAGAGASRLVVGTDPAYRELEERVAAFQGTEAALVFGSGYLANVGVLQGLLGPEDAVFSDRLNHASIWDGIRLSRATLYRYDHCDPDSLESLLREADRAGARRKLIVSDSVFSMDGDVAPVAELVELKERYDAALVVDEAHAGGVFGPHGQGLAHELGVADRVDLHVGTFSKAFGVYGGFVAGDASWIRHLLNTSRTFIYTTGLPPALVGAITVALELVREAGEARRELQQRACVFRARLAELGLDTCGSTTQIVPILVGESEAALELSRELEAHGVLGVAIRPPTVPHGTARLRCSLSALHKEAELELALAAIEQAARAASVLDLAGAQP
jgi:8-amino-7-oxononanoate synthase